MTSQIKWFHFSLNASWGESKILEPLSLPKRAEFVVTPWILGITVPLHPGLPVLRSKHTYANK